MRRRSDVETGSREGFVLTRSLGVIYVLIPSRDSSIKRRFGECPDRFSALSTFVGVVNAGLSLDCPCTFRLDNADARTPPER